MENKETNVGGKKDNSAPNWPTIAGTTEYFLNTGSFYQ